PVSPANGSPLTGNFPARPDLGAPHSFRPLAGPDCQWVPPAVGAGGGRAAVRAAEGPGWGTRADLQPDAAGNPVGEVHGAARAKAVGMWQFMKRTARLYGMRVDSWVDERRDPYRATDAAVHHLADLNRRFGSFYLAAAAYNAGSGKVSRGLVRLPEDDTDSLNSDATFFRLYDTKLLRRETKDYVPKLIAAA